MLSRGSQIKERIIRTLLNSSEDNLTKYRLAKLSQCKYPSVHRTLKELEALGLVKGTKAKKIKELFKVWLSWKKKPKTREYMIREPLDIIKKTNLQYSLTTYQAENLIQNYLFPSRTDIYVQNDHLIKWHKIFVKEGGLVGKGNVRIIAAHDDHIFYNSFLINDLRVVSIPQLIVDLYEEGGACIEAADMLMKKVIENAL